MKKIGIMGGTFDPIHKIHLEIAKVAKVEYDLDEVFLMPAKYPPHKLEQQLSSDEDRWKMVKLSCEDLKGITGLDIELKMDKVSYTCDTLSLLSERYPNTEIYFIMGGDSVLYLEKWKNPDVIFKKATILYAAREGASMEAIQSHIEKTIKKLYPEARLFSVSFPETFVSSTFLREELKKRRYEMVKDYLHPYVLKYIMDNNLYSK